MRKLQNADEQCITYTGADNEGCTNRRGLNVLLMLGKADNMIVVCPRENIILSGGCCPRCIGLATPEKWVVLITVHTGISSVNACFDNYR